MGRRSGQSGLTLIEILIACAIGGVIATTVGSLFVYTMRQFSSLVLQSQAQQELQWVSYHLQSLFSGSVVKNLEIDKYTTPSLTPTSNNQYNCKLWDDGATCGHSDSDIASSTVKVASILTDRVLNFTKNDFTLGGDPIATGSVSNTNHSSYVYFIEPYVNKPGILCIVFSLGKANSAGVATRGDRYKLHNEACKLLDDNSTVEVEPYALGFKLLGFEAEIKSSSGESTIIDMTLHNRYFFSSSPKNLSDRGHRYYSADHRDTAACKSDPNCHTSINWGDVEHKLQVNLRNNIFEYIYDGSNTPTFSQVVDPSKDVTPREGSFGKILFYKMALPANSYITRGQN